MHLICGLLQLDGAKASDTIAADMACTMAPPGHPFSTQVCAEGPVAFAVLQTGTDDGGGFVQGRDGSMLVADLRLDRPDDVADELGLPKTSSPQGLALAGLARWQEALPDRLDGDYAIAAWNPHAHRLTLARDIFAVRPLCYCLVPGRLFAFASLPRAIHGTGLVPAKPDLPALARRLLTVYDHSNATGYQNIVWLEAGHVLTIDGDGRTRTTRAWKPDPAAVGRWRGTHQDAAATLRELVRNAVETRLPATGGVASHLSGGLDSSAVAVLAARKLAQTGRRLRAYAFLTPRGQYPRSDIDRQMIEALLAQENAIDRDDVDIAATDPLSLVDCDQPVMNFEQANHFHTYRLAASAGASMLLTGAGGDEAATFDSGRIHAELFKRGKWGAIIEDLRPRARFDGITLPQIILQRVLAPLLPERILRSRRRLLRRPIPGLYHRPALPFLSPQLREAVADFTPAMEVKIGIGPEGRIQFLQWGFLQSRNTVWAAMGARAGINLAHPLLDRRVIDFALSLPLERLVHGGHSRQPFRDAMKGVLPDCLRLARVKGDSLPGTIAAVLRAKPALLAAAATLHQSPAAKLLNIGAIEEALIALPDDAKHFDNILRRQAATIFRAITLAQHLTKMSCDAGEIGI